MFSKASRALLILKLQGLLDGTLENVAFSKTIRMLFFFKCTVTCRATISGFVTNQKLLKNHESDSSTKMATALQK